MIHEYIAWDSNHYVTRVVWDISARVKTLSELPNLGRMLPEIGEKNVREIGMYSYRIMYELMEDTVCIHGVFHKWRYLQPEDLDR